MGHGHGGDGRNIDGAKVRKGEGHIETSEAWPRPALGRVDEKRDTIRE